MPDRAGIPEAWPTLLTREQACAYLGLSEGTFRAICPIAAVDLGVALLRWRRADLDAWVAGLPGRLMAARKAEQDAPPAVTDPADERRLSSVERAKARMGTRCRKTPLSPSPSSSESPARAAG